MVLRGSPHSPHTYRQLIFWAIIIYRRITIYNTNRTPQCVGASWTPALPQLPNRLLPVPTFRVGSPLHDFDMFEKAHLVGPRCVKFGNVEEQKKTTVGGFRHEL